MRYRITHTSHYEYDRGVAASFNEARLTPAQTLWQTRLESDLHVEPSTWHHRFTDYWGTEVRVFEANSAHRALTVRATSLVEVDASRRPAPGDPSWAQLRAPDVVDRFVEYLTQTPVTTPPDELRDLAESIAADHRPVAAVERISDAVSAALTYVPGATEVHTTAAEAWAERSGVCQDYTHLLVGALRHVGVPARYVSGYLHPAADPAVGETARGESHAWAEGWLGEWAPHDPTNRAAVAERHVMVGTGRDYGDVPPIKGIVAGPHRTNSLAVTVELTRLA
nr:transglutaminase family protein [Jatrophihabitans endophyticus]